MALSSGQGALRNSSSACPASLSSLLGCGQLETREQIRGFELLRLAFFALKLRKLELRQEQLASESEHIFCCNLLRHVIFQQFLTLISLDAREQAMQLINACRR